MTFLPAIDLAAIAYFAVAGSAMRSRSSGARSIHGGLNARIHRYREVWMQPTLSLEARMVDMRIIGRELAGKKAHNTDILPSNDTWNALLPMTG